MDNLKMNFPVYDPEICRFFALGRNAMYAACIAMGLKEGDEVLTPAFDCDGALEPFKVLGLRMHFYRSDPYTFCVDLDDIAKKVRKNVKLIHVVNHFGMPQPWEGILRLRERTGMLILEDNAYSLFSSIGSRRFGTFGDTSIFSLRKNLPLLDGGMLRINNPEYNFKRPSSEMPLFCRENYKGLLRILVKKAGLKTLMRHICNPNDAPPPLNSDKGGYARWPARDLVGNDFACDYLRGISCWAGKQLVKFSQACLQDIGNKKIYYYNLLSDRLKNVKGITMLWPKLPEGTVPFCCNILLDLHRDDFLRTLRKKYSVMAWPTLSKLVLDQLDEFPDVDLLGRKLFQINLPSEEVSKGNFPGYLDNLVTDIERLTDKYSVMI